MSRPPFRIALLLLPALTLAQSYTFTEFDVPGATLTAAAAINNAGQILGSYNDSKGVHCFLRDPGGAFTTFDPPGASPLCAGLNNRGEVVGTTDRGAHGFIRSATGDFTTFDIPAAGPGAAAAGINDLGEIVGTLAAPPEGGNGFLRSPDGAFVRLTAPIGEIDPIAINNRGEIAGWVLNGSSQGTQHGFLRDAGGVYRKFDFPGTTSFTRIAAIANTGQFAGTASGGGFVSNPDGSFTLLPGHPVSGLNDAGRIVGGGNGHAFLGAPGPGVTQPTIRNVLSAMAFGGAPTIAPGAWIEIYGEKLAPATRPWRPRDFIGDTAPTSLDGVTVSIGGIPAFVSYISPGQVNALVPSTVAPGDAGITVTTGGQTSAPVTVTVKATQPALLSLPPDFDPNGAYIAALFPDFTTYALPPYPSVPTRRPKPGDTIVLFGMGFGPVVPATPVGRIAPASTSLAASVAISFSRTGAPVPGAITYAGLAPGTVGLYQFNVVVPDIPLLPNETSDDFINVFFTADGASALGRRSLYFTTTK